ncbi:MAG: diadenylate cyclase CdaA [Clostridiales bacterium]|nr:diadenylate cyclase CdaA [Clostridiales bacterium]
MSFSNILDTLASGLAQFRWTDALDIIVIAFLLYKLIMWTRGTQAFEVLKGIGLLLIFSVLARLLQMPALGFLLESILSSGSIIIVLFILFQTEIRRVLERIGRSGKTLTGVLSEGSMGLRAEDFSRDIQASILRLSRRRVGALIVFEMHTGLSDIMETGTRIDGQLSGALLENIFEPNTPLHDGAVIAKGDRLLAAACYLPLSDDTELSRELGTRHRAAVGVSSVSDAIVLIVSEETGAISMAQDGKLVRYLDASALRNILENLYLKQNGAGGGLRKAGNNGGRGKKNGKQ